jgi:hypothetical protein
MHGRNKKNCRDFLLKKGRNNYGDIRVDGRGILKSMLYK